MSLGTPTYMGARSRAMGERTLDARTDVYALGCVLYEMLNTGEPPFTGPTAQAIVAEVLTDEPRPASELRRSVPPNVEAAIRTALESFRPTASGRWRSLPWRCMRAPCPPEKRRGGAPHPPSAPIAVAGRGARRGHRHRVAAPRPSCDLR